ncbi:MAG: YeeE/YedE family protein [Parvularculaceae bacterium]
MRQNLTALIAGAVFGIGLTVSEMINPAKVIGFLDLFGNWDPSLAFTMGGGLIVTAIGYRLVWRRSTPIFSEQYQLPQNTQIDKNLALGAILFGTGWGLAGLCPGPAIAAISIGGIKAMTFVVAMIAGIVIFEFVLGNRRPKTIAA